MKKMQGKEGECLTMVTMEGAIASRWRGRNNHSRSRAGARDRVGVCDDLVTGRGEYVRILKVVGRDKAEAREVERGGVGGDLCTRLGCGPLNAVDRGGPALVVGHGVINPMARYGLLAQLGGGSGGSCLGLGEGKGKPDEHAACEEVQEIHGRN